MKSSLPLIIALVVLPGCEWLNQNLGWGPGRPGAEQPPRPPADTQWWEDDDPTGWQGPPVVNSIGATCTVVGGVAEFEVVVDLQSWAADVTLDVYASRDDDRLETFPFPVSANIDFCEDGSCDQWSYTLIEAEVYSRDAGQTTLDCTALGPTESGLFADAAFRIQAEPDNVSFGSECAIWGHRSRELFGNDCDCFDAFLVDPPANPCGSHP